MWGNTECNRTSNMKHYYSANPLWQTHSCGPCITCQLPWQEKLCTQKLQLYFTRTYTIMCKTLANHCCLYVCVYMHNMPNLKLLPHLIIRQRVLQTSTVMHTILIIMCLKNVTTIIAQITIIFLLYDIVWFACLSVNWNIIRSGWTATRNSNTTIYPEANMDLLGGHLIFQRYIIMMQLKW